MGCSAGTRQGEWVPWEAESQPPPPGSLHPPVPGMPYPKELWLEAASLGWHGSRGLPAVPLTGASCLAEEHPLLPSLPSTSPSCCAKWGGSPAKEMIETVI